MQNFSFDSIFEFSRKEVEKQKHYYDVIALKITQKVIAAFRKHQGYQCRMQFDYR